MITGKRQQAAPRLMRDFNETERDRQLRARRKLGLPGQPWVFANIGQRHQDYGMTPAEHEYAKANGPKDSALESAAKVVVGAARSAASAVAKIAGGQRNV